MLQIETILDEKIRARNIYYTTVKSTEDTIHNNISESISPTSEWLMSLPPETSPGEALFSGKYGTPPPIPELSDEGKLPDKYLPKISIWKESKKRNHLILATTHISTDPLYKKCEVIYQGTKYQCHKKDKTINRKINIDKFIARHITIDRILIVLMPIIATLIPKCKQ